MHWLASFRPWYQQRWLQHKAQIGLLLLSSHTIPEYQHPSHLIALRKYTQECPLIWISLMYWELHYFYIHWCCSSHFSLEPQIQDQPALSISVSGRKVQLKMTFCRCVQTNRSLRFCHCNCLNCQFLSSTQWRLHWTAIPSFPLRSITSYLLLFKSACRMVSILYAWCWSISELSNGRASD